MPRSLAQWVAMYLLFGVFWALIINLLGSMNGGSSVFTEIAASEPFRTKIMNIAQTLAPEVFLWPLQLLDRGRQMIFG
jgi:hypothetical protein